MISLIKPAHLLAGVRHRTNLARVRAEGGNLRVALAAVAENREGRRRIDTLMRIGEANGWTVRWATPIGADITAPTVLYFGRGQREFVMLRVSSYAARIAAVDATIATGPHTVRYLAPTDEPRLCDIADALRGPSHAQYAERAQAEELRVPLG